MRRFFIENSIGERRDLQTKQEVHLRSPAGLGWADNNVYGDARGFFPRTDSRPAQQTITGDLVIKGYNTYKNLVDWLLNGYDLTLIYSPDGTEYRINIDIQSLSKGEINEWGRLECPFVMMAKSPWYRTIARELSITPPVGSFKKYSYAYPFQYAVASLANSVDLIAAGHMPAAVYITIPGPLTNPRITLKRDGIEIGRMDLNGVSIESGKTLTFSTRPGSVGVWENNTDLLEHLDLNNENFFSVPTGVTVTMTLESDTDIATTAAIRLYEYYRSV